MMNAVIQAAGLSYRVREKLLLDGIDIALHPGELHAVIGRNGAGKSTLLKLLSGELAPAAGRILLDGKPLGDHPVRDLARRRAVLAQHTTLTFNYRALEVVLLGRLPHLGRRAETDADRAIAREALDRVGLAAFADRGYLTLSGGEQQRVHLARTLTQLSGEDVPGQPKILFLDEPTSSLDLHHQHQILALARELSAAGAAVFAILHDLNLAARYADRITLLGEGRLLATGRPAEVLTQSLLESAFHHPLHIRQHPCHDCPLIVPV